MARYPSVQYVSLYTDGSAARKMDFTVPVRKQPRAKAKKLSKIVVRVDPIAIMGIITAIVMMAVMVVGFVQLQAVQQEAAVMSAYVQQLRAENKSLRSEFEAGYDIEQVSHTAQALGMVPKSEVRHVRLEVTPQVEQPVGVWARFCAFLTGLFA